MDQEDDDDLMIVGGTSGYGSLQLDDHLVHVPVLGALVKEYNEEGFTKMIRSDPMSITA